MVSPTIGFLLGAYFICLTRLYHTYISLIRKDAEGLSTNWQKTILLVLAIVYNIPEGQLLELLLVLAHPEFIGLEMEGIGR